ncbi:MAG: hypothetical protein C5B52_00925 [Bacteroidetes bacterium]|nr:MAG: hypothetical protein C5B52_00925 [Bacteroidota bacterium]
MSLRPLILSCIALLFACNQSTAPKDNFNDLAEKYVRLGLSIGQYDSDFVDAYYGPDSLKPKTTKLDAFPKDSLLKLVDDLKFEFKKYTDSSNQNDTIRRRAVWITKQLTAFSRRIKIFSGELKSFDEEALEIFDVKVPDYSEDNFKALVAELDKSLPGKGSISERVDQLANRFIIPKEKVDTVFKAAIEEARKRTHSHYDLPQEESFTLEYVNNKPWSGYNWYKGNYHSVIQINLDVPIYIDRAIDLACHEGYPGHHVYNMMLEKNLYHDKGWVEISLYPLFSPQSLIAEGSANYGIDLSFPGTEKNTFTKSKLLPLAGLDSTNLDLYYKVISIKGQLNYVRNEVARGLLSGSMTDSVATKWLTQYALMSPLIASKSISFIRKYRAYVICYNYGQELVKNFVEHNGGLVTVPNKRWQVFGWLLSNPVTPTDLIQDKPIP